MAPKYIDVEEAGRKRWEGVSDEKRSELMSAASRSKWDRMSEEERKAHGAMLTEARAKARDARQKATKKAAKKAKKVGAK